MSKLESTKRDVSLRCKPLCAAMSNLSEHETLCIAKVRKQLGDELCQLPYFTDFNILRCIQGMGEEMAAQWLRGIVAFKRYYRIGLEVLDEEPGIPADYIHDETYEMVRRAYPIGVLGPTGVDDRILVIEPAGKIDAIGVVKTTTISRFLRYRMEVQERIQALMMAEEAKTGRQASCLYVVDLDGIKFSKEMLEICVGPYAHLWVVIFCQYPEWVSLWVMVNVPPWLNLVWKALGGLLGASTKAKLRLFAPTEDWRSALRAWAGPAVLPKLWGGQRLGEGGDPMAFHGWTTSDTGEEWRVDRDKNWSLFPAPSSLPRFRVPAGRKLRLAFPPLSPGQRIAIVSHCLSHFRFSAWSHVQEQKDRSDYNLHQQDNDEAASPGEDKESEWRLFHPPFTLPSLPSTDRVDTLAPGGRLAFHFRNPNWLMTIDVGFRLLVIGTAGEESVVEPTEERLVK